VVEVAERSATETQTRGAARSIKSTVGCHDNYAGP